MWSLFLAKLISLKNNILTIIGLCAFTLNVSASELVNLPFRFIDSLGNEVDSYCVIPIYVKSYGIGWGAEATGRKYGSDRYLMWPSVVKKGSKSNIKVLQQKSFSILSFAMTYGEAFAPSEILIIKKGYLPILWNRYVDTTINTTIVFKNGNSENALQILLTNDDNKNIKYLFSLPDNVSIINKYTKVEKELIRKCYYIDAQ
jgi:hypothetical protein